MKSLLKPLLASLVAVFAAGHAQGDVTPRNEQVVLLHGILRSSAHMSDLEKYLIKKGYTVYNLDYPSTAHRLDKLAAIIAKEIAETTDASQPLHFVGYSMGGIVTRIVLNKYRPDNLGRAVQLASPNSGSEVADFLQENWLYETIYGPAGQQLVTENAGIDGLMGPVDYEMGVIAGNFSIDPISSSIIPGDDDGKVSVESTKVRGMRDHITVRASHSFFPQNRQVHAQTFNFLRFGAFRR